MKILPFFLFSAILCQHLQAQSGPASIFALVQKTAPAAKNQPAVDSARYNHAFGIYDRLVKAGGKTRVPAPKFVMNRNERYMAWLDKKTMEIGLELKAYDAALAQGKDAALALLLARPLVQFYETHDSLRALSAAPPKAGQQEEMVNYLGSFLAYSAGYGVFEKGPDLLAALYNAYKLPAQVKGYPTLEERKKIDRNAGEKLRKLVEVFEVGNLLTALNKYEDAYAYFQYQLRDYKSREICNNAGVVATLNALSYFRPKEPEIKFRYPLQIDLNSVASRDLNDLREVRNRLLREAIGHFDAAIGLSPGYAPAWLNKACAYALLGETAQAQSLAEAALQKAGVPEYQTTAAGVQVLFGILQAQKGDLEQATAAFKLADEQGSSLGGYNLQILKGEEPEIAAVKGSGLLGKKEAIDSLSLSDPYNLPETVPESEIRLGAQLSLFHNLHPGPNSRFYSSVNTATGKETYFLLTGPGYTGQTAKKLKAGATRAEIEDTYKQPLRVIETPTGEIRVYNNIILLLDMEGKLARWALYGEK